MMIPANFTPAQVAQLLILRNLWLGQDSPWKDAEFTPEELAQHWADNWPDIENLGCQNNVRYEGDEASGIKTRCHYSWERHYDVEVRVIHLGDGRGLAYNFMSGGGKHGDPDAYKWYDEAWFVKCTGTKTTVSHTYEDIPEVPDEQPAS